MTEQRKNSYDDEDMQQILEEIEELKAEQVSIRAKAAAECGGISKKIGNVKGRAKELGIPLTILSGLLKSRELERKLDAVSASIPADLVEIWEDAAGQFSLFAPDDGEGSSPSPVQASAQRRKTAAEENEAREQEEGAELIDGLVN